MISPSFLSCLDPEECYKLIIKRTEDQNVQFNVSLACQRCVPHLLVFPEKKSSLDLALKKIHQ